MIRKALVVFGLGSVLLFAQPPQAPPAGGRGGRGAGGGGGLTPGPTDKPVVDDAKADRGKQTFVQHCAFCHGTDAAGGEGGPDLIRSVVVAHDKYGEELAKVVRPGVPDKGMPGFNLTDPQIEEISHFLHQRVAEKARRGAFSDKNILTGNAKSGETYFKGAGTCTTCHSATGDLAGVGKKYGPLDLQQRMVFPRGGRGGGASKPVEVTVTPAGGKAVTGTLVRMDDFTVAMRDSGGEYLSWKRTPSLKVETRDPYTAHIQLLDKFTDADIHHLVAYLETLK